MTTRCPIMLTNGKQCDQDPHPASWYDVCTEHWRAIIEDLKRATVDDGHLSTVTCPVCKTPAGFGVNIPYSCSNPNCWADRFWEKPAPDADIPTRKGTNRVYYIRFGDRIKIGTSGNLKPRLSTLSYDELLALEPGTVELERQRHRHFAHLLIPGQREWFQIADDLLDHVARTKESHGDPVELRGAA